MNKMTKSKIPENTYIFAGIAILIIINVYLAFVKGPIMSSDSHFYSAEADKVISLDFNVFQYLGTSDPNVEPLPYMVFILLVAFLKILFGQYWGFGLISLNLIFSSFAIICFFRLVQTYSKFKLTIIIGFLFLLLAGDLRLWNAYVLTDTIFSSLVFFTVFFAVTTINSNSRIKPINILWSSLLLLTMVIFRPTSPPIVVAIGLYWSWFFLVAKIKIEENRGRLNRYLFLFLFFSVVICIFLFAYLIHLASISQLESSSNFFNGVVKMFSEGWIIHDRPELSHIPPANYFDFVIIILERLIFFFAFTSGSFSQLHNLINVLFFVPSYILALVGAINFFRSYLELTDIRKNVSCVCIMTTICFSVFHSVTLIDFDWRYRLPILLPLITLACLGSDYLFSRFIPMFNVIYKRLKKSE